MTLLAIGKDTNGSMFYYNENTGKYVYGNGRPFNMAKMNVFRKMRLPSFYKPKPQSPSPQKQNTKPSSSPTYGFGRDVSGKAIFSVNGTKWVYTNGKSVPYMKVIQSPYPIRAPKK